MAEQTPVWFITGASKGMGLEAVRAALAAGARVVATSRDADQLSTRLGVDNSRFTAVTMSLTDPDDIAAAVRLAVDSYGRIDVLVNNAGYSVLGAVEEISRDAIHANFDINVFGLIEVTQQVLPVMRRQRSGRIINLASISANVTGPATGLYSATKAAVLMLTEALAAEIEPMGVYATAVCPGGVRTDFLDKSSSRRPDTTIDDYKQVQAVLRQYDSLNHQQGGDPQLVAQALLKIAELTKPPTRIYLGSDALQAIAHQAHTVLQDLQQYEHLSTSIDN